MTPTGLWLDIGAGENGLTKAARLLFLTAGFAIFTFLAVLPLTWPQQAVCGLLTLLIALAVARSSDSYLITLTLMIMDALDFLCSAFHRPAGQSHRPAGRGTHDVRGSVLRNVLRACEQ